MSGSVVRPLPARPDLESEKKRAKQLLREVRRGDAEALARVATQNRALVGAAPDTVKLADAHLTIAREYGFRSWPLLVRYYESFARQQRSDIRSDRGQGIKSYEGWVRTLLAEHRDRRFWAASLIESFVPRFYGASIEEIFDATIAEDEARYVVARQYGFANWSDVLATGEPVKPDPWREAEIPVREMTQAIRAGDLPTLQDLVQRHPELLTVTGRGGVPTIASTAAIFHLRDGTKGRDVLKWVESLGFDVRALLNQQLLGFLGGGMTVEQVERLLDAGADPSWVAPNGYSVLEHAIQRYWNGEAVDAIARRVKPPSTLFVACGLGDVTRMREYFDRSGKLTSKAIRERPDMAALSGAIFPSMANPGHDMMLWELGFVAAVNGRGTAFDLLLSHGMPIDYNPGMTLLSFAVGNALLPMTELLVSRGASANVRGWRPNMTAREMAIDLYGSGAEDQARRRILLLLGEDPDAIRREYDATRQAAQPIPGLKQILDLARRDATRRGQSVVGAENLFVGMLKDSLILRLLGDSGTDLGKLRDRYGERLADAPPPAGETGPDFDGEVESILERTRDDATRRRDGMTPWDVLLHAVTSDTRTINRLITEFGGDPRKLVETLGSRSVPRPL